MTIVVLMCSFRKRIPKPGAGRQALSIRIDDEAVDAARRLGSDSNGLIQIITVQPEDTGLLVTMSCLGLDLASSPPTNEQVELVSAACLVMHLNHRLQLLLPAPVFLDCTCHKPASPPMLWGPRLGFCLHRTLSSCLADIQHSLLALGSADTAI